MLPEETGFFSRVFLVPKRPGSQRLVINLSVLNQYPSPVTFQDRNLGKSQESASTRRLSLHAAPQRQCNVHVLPNKRDRVYVSGSAIWTDDGPVGIKEVVKQVKL